MNIEDWFSGFFEADGYFSYSTNRRKMSRFPVVGITQLNNHPARIASILIGGKTHYVIPKSKYSGRELMYAPRYKWEARDKQSLLNALWYFDQCPLIGPKAEDYVIWRKIVMRYVEHGWKDNIFWGLCDELSDLKGDRKSAHYA